MQLGRFISADVIVSGTARLTPLTVGFHETMFLGQANEENRQLQQVGPIITWNKQLKQQFGVPAGPVKPQTLNRFAYALNNPLGRIDPTGHSSLDITLSAEQAQELVDWLLGKDGSIGLADALKMVGQGVVYAGYLAGIIAAVLTAGAPVINIIIGALVAGGIAIYGERLKNTAETLKDLASLLNAEIEAGSTSIKIEVKSELWGDRISVHGQQIRAIPAGRFLNYAGDLLKFWMIFGDHQSPVLAHGIFASYYIRRSDGTFALGTLYTPWGTYRPNISPSW